MIGRKSLFTSLATLFLLALGLVPGKVDTVRGDEDSTSHITVNVVRPTVRSVAPTSRHWGVVHPYRKITLVTPAHGVVRKVHISPGQMAKPGQKLMDIDMTGVVAKIASLQGMIEVGKRRIEEVQAQAKLHQAEYQRHFTQVKELDKLVQWYKKVAAARSGSDKIEYQTRQKEVEAKVAVAKKEERLAYRRLSVQWKKVATEKARQKILADEKKSLEKSLQEGSIRSPYGGAISAVHVYPGQRVHAGPRHSTHLATLVQLDRVRLMISVPTKLADQIATGGKVSIQVSLPGGKSPQTVTIDHWKWDGGEPGMGRTAVAIMKNPGGLHPGMKLAVTISGAKKSSVILVPTQCLWIEGGKYYLFAVEDGMVVKKEVKVGQGDGTYLEITDGLSGREKIALTGRRGLREGQLVKAVER